MDFNDSPDEAAFRQEARAWIAAHAPDLPRTRRRRHPDAYWLPIARDWQAKKADAGYVGIAWPREWGGQGGSMAQQILFDEEEQASGLRFSYFDIGLGICIPTIASCADAATVRRFGRPAMRADEIWCQLFSEPVAGSDLAGIRTRAVRDGDGWVINGQKVWTSGAQFCDFGLLITRTNPDVPKHRGMTMFWINMKDRGVEIRPIRQIYGDSDFNEVFLTDVRIPDTQRVGPVDAGWTVALATLMNERVAVGHAGGPGIAELVAAAQSVPRGDGTAADAPDVQAMVVAHYLRAEGVRLTRYRQMTAIARGEAPGPENAVAKLVSASIMQTLAHDALMLQGAFGLLDEPALDPFEASLQESLLWSPGYRIAGGTDEILRTILAERVLGLPPDLRADKDRPFRELSGGNR
jgi:alkylation response protein AidB-like acyl-CoA dehydrogenase